MSSGLRVAVVLSLGLLPCQAFAQEPLPLGEAPRAARAEAGVAAFRFEASSAGVLSIAVRGEGDLRLVVADIDGQVLPDGVSDRDLFGQVGTEQVSVMIGEAGTYTVSAELLDGSPEFEIGGSWIPFPALARPSDPDGRPSRAREIRSGRDEDGALDGPNGDAQDWFVLTPERDGVLTVVLRPAGDEVDLVLGLYVEEFGDPAVQSDQDLQGDTANEIATLTVTRGRPVHVKVSGYGTDVSGRYRLSTSLIE